jgi:glycosyltransferase involved in cell wall biosynthesis
MAFKLHLWFPDIFQFKGGIQVYSAFLLQAIAALYPDADLEVLLKHDSQALPDLPLAAAPKYTFAGKYPLLLRTLAYTAQLLNAGLRSRPDLVIASHINFAQAAYWLKRLNGTPYWAIAHGIEAWNIQNPRLIHALRHADRILAVSEFTRDRLIQAQNLDPAKVLLLPNTFDSDRFQIAPKPIDLLKRHVLRPEQPIMLTVARLSSSEQYKGYDQILQAMPQLLTLMPNLHYLIVGKGSDRPRIETMIEQLGIQSSVTLVGFVPDAELKDYYNLCDLFAMPSKGEGFGIVYLEALACGKPVLGGNQDGAIDALCHGRLGVLVNPDSVDEISQAIAQILQKTYPHPLIYQPQNLREAAIAEFGNLAFGHKLASLLEQQL